MPSNAIPTFSRRGFTLVEVMIAVAIISVVVLGLLRLYAHNSEMLSGLERRTDATLTASLLQGDADAPFTSRQLPLYDLVRNFPLEDTLRRRLENRTAVLKRRETANGAETPAKTPGGTPAPLLETSRIILEIDGGNAVIVRMRLR